MVKRIVSLGAAVALILSLTVSSFAYDVTTKYNFGFPYFGRTRLLQGSTELIPTTTFDSDNPVFRGSYSDSFSNSSTGDITFYFYGNSVGSYSCRSISGGSYAIDGYLEFASSSSVDGSDFGVPRLRISNGSNVSVEDFDVVSYEYRVVNGTSNKRIHYSFVFDVYSSVYDYSYIQFLIPVTGSFSLIGWSTYTGAADIDFTDVNLSVQESAEYAHNTSLFSRLFNVIASGVSRIVDAVKDDSDAQQAAEEADTVTNTEDQSIISEVEQYESNLNSTVSSSVSQLQQNNYLDLSSTTSTYLQALGVVSYVFGAVFGTLGGHQVVITIPLVLGIVLLLVGRGSMALGRHMDLSVRAARRSKGSGGGSS